MKQKLNLRFFMTLVIGIFVSVNALAQDIIVKGHVKDDQGEDVTGATVRVKGTSAGVVTDIYGNFTLKAKKGATIAVSFIGYISQEVKAAQNLNIVLKEDAKLLNETVVVGYGSVKKNDLTGSVVAIKPDEMTKGITTSMQDMLTGKISGVSVISNGGDPSASSSIRIRGGASLNASNDPLIVIDGLAMDNNGVQGLGNPLSMVNPDDIETITVLKDASSTAIYGSRGSNGVIIITTKKGTIGKKPKITYNGNVSVATPRKTYELLSGDEFRTYAKSLVEAGTLSDAAYSQLGTANTDWQDQIYRTAVSTDHQVGISGSLPHMPYRVSLGYTNKNGIAEVSNFERFTGSVNLNPSLLDDHLTMNVNAKYMHGKNTWADYAIFGNAVSADPTQDVYNSSYETTGGYWQNLITNAPTKLTDWTNPVTNTNTAQNPKALLENFHRTSKSNVFIGNIEADYKIHGFEDLRIHGNISGDYSEGNDPTNISPYSYSNNYYGYTGLKESYKYNLSGNIYVDYSHEWEDVQSIDVMVGTEEQHFHRNFWEVGGGNYVGTQLVPSESNYYSPQLKSETQHIYVSTVLSYFGRLNYSLYDKYLLTATLRNDRSSFFSKEKRSGWFPSVALAWKINEEAFLKDNEVLTNLKLRLGWGKTGQQALPDDLVGYFAPRYVISDSYAQYALGDKNYYTVRPETYNKNLTWEKTATWNAGIDYGFLNGRIDGSLEYYYRKTTDLLSQVSIGPMVNFGNYMWTNFGDLSNHGIEFNINAHPIVTKDFSWSINYNVSYNKNEITKLNLGSGQNYVLTGSSISAGLSNQVMAHKEGYAANSFYVYQQVYDDNGKPIEGQFVDRNGDGKITADDKYIYNHAAGDVLMGMTNKFIYKNWDFSFTLRASLNNYVYYDFLSNKANVSAAGIYSNSAFSNTTAEAINLGFQGKKDYYLSDYFVRNASFLRCDNITLGYSFDRLFETANYHGVGGRVYFLVQNPFVITKYKGLDPEVSASKDNVGIDKNLYPRPTTFMLGVSLNF
ncbi:MAG: TonB-dependent receptor [Bacteroidaceae bacterium]|nr:TonB-dependent receptor [Bacteroidaceae bacterium]